MPDIPVIAVIEDVEDVREAVGELVRELGFAYRLFPGADRFLAAFGRERLACVVTDLRMLGRDELQRELVARGVARLLVDGDTVQ